MTDVLPRISPILLGYCEAGIPAPLFREYASIAPTAVGRPIEAITVNVRGDEMPDQPTAETLPAARRVALLTIGFPRLGDWAEQAACVGKDPRLFDKDDADCRDALRICADCLVVTDCLRDAMTHERTRARWGVRGGLTVSQRADLARRTARRGEAVA